MSRRRCCCGSTTPCGSCPALPSDWSTRDYKLFVPSVKPVTYGRISETPSGLYQGPCDTGDQYWNRPLCDFDFTGTYPYTYPAYTSCAAGSQPYCAKAGSIGPRFIGGMNTGNMVPQIVSSTGEANFTLEDLTDPNGYSIRVNIRRCNGGPFSNACAGCNNRTKVTIRYVWSWQYSYFDNCRTVTTTDVSELLLEYLSDPFTTALGIGRVCYLRAWSVLPGNSALLCFGETGARACADYCSLGSCSFDGASNFPATVLIS